VIRAARLNEADDFIDADIRQLRRRELDLQQQMMTVAADLRGTSTPETDEQRQIQMDQHNDAAMSTSHVHFGQCAFKTLK